MMSLSPLYESLQAKGGSGRHIQVLLEKGRRHTIEGEEINKEVVNDGGILHSRS